MIVCLCKAASDRDIAAAIEDGARSVGQVGQRCGAGTDCGACRMYIRKMIGKSAKFAARDEDCAQCPGACAHIAA